MTKYAGVFVTAGGVRQITFEAENAEEAKQLAQRWGVGVTGEAREHAAEVREEPQSYDEKTAGVLITGNPEKPLSRASLYRLVAVGSLTRVPSTRRFLITRKSLEAYCSGGS
jgi:hypothetical protein